MPPEADSQPDLRPSQEELEARLTELGMTVPPIRLAPILDGARQRRREVALLQRCIEAMPEPR